MKVAVISDVHGNYDSLMHAFDDMNKQDISDLICLGDLIFGGSGPLRCVKAIQEMEPLAWIMGNTDDWLNLITPEFVPSNDGEKRVLDKFNKGCLLLDPETIAFMKKLPFSKSIQLSGRRVLCVHGSDQAYDDPIGTNNRQCELKEIEQRLEEDILLCGHTHIPCILQIGQKVIMNVGSVGQPRSKHRASYGILDINESGITTSIRYFNRKKVGLINV